MMTQWLWDFDLCLHACYYALCFKSHSVLTFMFDAVGLSETIYEEFTSIHFVMLLMISTATSQQEGFLCGVCMFPPCSR